jgi:hypothetical protein
VTRLAALERVAELARGLLEEREIASNSSGERRSTAKYRAKVLRQDLERALLDLEGT